MTIAVPDGKRLFPVVFNLASRAKISSNATCGDTGPERYCRLVEHVQRRPYGRRPRDRLHCDVCDSYSRSPNDAHPVTNAIDGSNSWWQSPTVTKGHMYNWVTLTLDLRQVGSSRVNSPSASWCITCGANLVSSRNVTFQNCAAAITVTGIIFPIYRRKNVLMFLI